MRRREAIGGKECLPASVGELNIVFDDESACQTACSRQHPCFPCPAGGARARVLWESAPHQRHQKANEAGGEGPTTGSQRSWILSARRSQSLGLGMAGLSVLAGVEAYSAWNR
jgi:hypothetical protein